MCLLMTKPVFNAFVKEVWLTHAALLPGISSQAVLTLLARGALSTLAEACVIAPGV